MDPSSIITQVRRADEDVGHSQASSSHSSAEKVSSKPKSPKLLKQIFCCFRPSNRSPRYKNRKDNGSSAVSPSSTRSDESQSLNTSGLSDGRFSEGSLLPALREQDKDKKCVVIDLDETLVHSSFVISGSRIERVKLLDQLNIILPVNNPDFIIPVEIDGTVHQSNFVKKRKMLRKLDNLYKSHQQHNVFVGDEKVYVLKRPHVDVFLQRMGEMFECVLFTASLGKYADPVTDLLDKWNVFRARLFRESCVFHRGNYVKDLSKLGRDLKQVIIIDNSPASYLFHRENAVPILTWFDDPNDTELLDLIPLFERLASGGPSQDVYTFLTNANIGGQGFGEEINAMSGDAQQQSS